MLNDHLHRSLADATGLERRTAAARRRRTGSRDADTEALLRAAAGGDERAWASLHDRFGTVIRAVARSHRLASHDVDDVIQATWLSLYRNVSRIREPEKLGAWLATTARHESLRAGAAAARERPCDDLGLADERAPEVPDPLARAECRAALREALEALPERHRLLMRMLAAEPALSYAAISAAAGIPIGSIGPIRGRCLARLRTSRRLAEAVAAEG